MAGIDFGWGSPPISVEGYRRKARRTLPHMAWTFLEAGAEDHVSLDANVAAFRKWRLRARVLTGNAKPVLATRLAGIEVSMPVGLAPVGLTGLLRWDGDVAAAQAAEAAGTRSVLSTSSSWSLEEVADATAESHWFQLYPYGDKRKVGELVDRAARAGYSALFVTVDAPVKGNREREQEAGMAIPIRLTPRSILDAGLRPRWWIDLLRHKRVAAIHYVQAGATGVSAAVGSAAALDRHLQGDLNWEDLAWLRDRWPGKLYVKGVLDAADAVRAVDAIGADGVVVSNHGGRQLDRVPATLDALPAIADAVGDRADVYLDGGIRRGVDIVTALALGAKGVFVGRAYAYGLAAGGRRGVDHVLAILREDIRRTLILMGCPGVQSLDRDWVMPAAT